VTADRFYRDIPGLETLMDHGGPRTYGNDDQARVQVSVAS